MMVSSLKNRCILPNFQQNAMYSIEKLVTRNFPKFENQNKCNTNILLRFLKIDIFHIYLSF